MLDLYQESLNKNDIKGGLLVAEMSTQDCLIDINYTEKNIEFANKYQDCIFVLYAKEKYILTILFI